MRYTQKTGARRRLSGLGDSNHVRELTLSFVVGLESEVVDLMRSDLSCLKVQ
jgi:hypothetical protein